MLHLENKRVILTGASSGIGKALAFLFAAKSAKLVLTSRNREKLEQVANEIQERYPQAPKPLVVPADVTREEEIKKLVAFSIEMLKGIDLLINCAGYGIYGDTERATLEDIRYVMEVNYLGAVNCILEVLPQMEIQKKGMIVNIASIAALYGVPYLSAYSASKSALVLFSQALRAELNKRKIKIINIYPGYTDTEFFIHEKYMGGAIYPRSTYTPVTVVAKKIIRTIEREKPEVILQSYGKLLITLNGLCPYWVRRAMNIVANRLKN